MHWLVFVGRYDVPMEKEEVVCLLHNFFSDFSQKSLHAYTKSHRRPMVIEIVAFESLHKAYTMPTSAYMVLEIYSVVTRII